MPGVKRVEFNIVLPLNTPGAGRAKLFAKKLMSEDRNQAAEDHYYCALDYVSEGRHEDAIAEYAKAIEADPTFADAMHGLTRAYQDAARYDEAIEIAQRLIGIDPDDILAHTSLSILYQRKGMIPEAEEEGNKARILGWKKQLAEQKKT